VTTKNDPKYEVGPVEKGMLIYNSFVHKALLKNFARTVLCFRLTHVRSDGH